MGSPNPSSTYADSLNFHYRRGQTPPVVVVEKIVAHDELPPVSWPIDGTTGYEFMARATGLFLDPAGYRDISTLGEQLGGGVAFAELALRAKREVFDASFGSEVRRLTRLARALLDDFSPHHDLSDRHLARALRELSVHLSVYRTYLTAGPATPEDLANLTDAAQRAADSLPGESRRALTLLHRAIVETRHSGHELVTRWQQLSGAAMAKGVEDTATYRYCGLLTHADVGGDPDRAICTVDDFHHFAEERTRYPNALNATSTHDSKRSEDARMRLCALSEFSSLWSQLVARWRWRYASSGLEVEDELRIHQSWVCLWPRRSADRTPDLVQRVVDYAVKSSREAKRRTSWAYPDDDYEGALEQFVIRLGRDRDYGREMDDLLQRIAPVAFANSIALLTLKCLTPGVPDFYQGTEYLTLTLTDPDNRSPIDVTRRRARRGGDGSTTPEGPATGDEDSLKADLTGRLLRYRRSRPELFAEGDYLALETEGTHRDHVLAFARHLGDQWVVSLVARAAVHLGPEGAAAGGSRWHDTRVRMPTNCSNLHWGDLLGDATVSVHDGFIDVDSCLTSLSASVLVPSSP